MIAVVGGGISGLSTAWYLAQAGLSCTLIEKRPRLGGVIETASIEDCVVEGGPDSFLAAKPDALRLIREVGLEQEVIGSNDHQRVTFIRKGGRLVPMPDGLMMMVPTKIWPMVTTPLLGWPTKIRMGLEYLRRPGVELPERSVSEFISSHYGQDAVDYLAEPLLSGVYGGDPRALSANAVLTRFVDMERTYGSLTRGTLAARKKAPPGGAPLFCTLKRGLGHLVETLVERIGGRMQVVPGEAEALERTGGGYRLRVGGQWMDVSQLVLAAPAYASARLLAPLDPELARLLDTVAYSSSMTLALVYRPGRIQQQLTGFGFLVPRKELRFLRACTFVHRKFSHRAPEGWAVIRCFLGGMGNEGVLGLSDATVLAESLRDLRAMLGPLPDPDSHRITRWHRGMAQYTVGHHYRMKQVWARLKAFPGIHLAGNAFNGIGIPDCIQTGRAAAQAIAEIR